jgi:hypothetical protein
MTNMARVLQPDLSSLPPRRTMERPNNIEIILGGRADKKCPFPFPAFS